MPGTGTVILPSLEHGPVMYPDPSMEENKNFIKGRKNAR